MKIFQFSITMMLVLLLAGSAQAGTIVEDFTTLNYADLQNSTAVWNIIDHSARSAAFANGAVDATRPISFGDGSDGVVNSSTGFNFNTDSHPAGYNFQSLTISGGVINVSGSHPLIVRSLSTITIGSAVSATGLDGDPGNISGAAIIGKAAKTCSAKGGDGGSAVVAAGSNGAFGIQSDGTSDATSSPGLGETGVVYNPSVEAGGSVTGPASNDFETTPAASFIGGTSGPGGGGFSDGTTNFASGGSGGAGGGVLKIVSVGDLTLGATLAKGGNGGNGVTINAAPCSGNGSGGNGGVIFLQTLGTLVTAPDPDVSGGNSGVSSCSPASIQGLAGFDRGDTSSTSVRPAWATGAGSFDTDIVPPTLQSFVQSKAYDLGTLNVGFSTAPTLTIVAPAPGSAVAATYAASVDGNTFSAFTSDITTLSNLGYRFLKFRVTFTNPTAAGVAPKITKVSIPYSEMGLAKLDIKLSPGCATIQDINQKNGGKKRPTNPATDVEGALSALFWFSLWLFAFRFHSFGTSRARSAK